MLLTFALVIVGSAILVFFSQEFGNLFKKFFAIPGVKLFLPLFAASLLVAAYEPWVLWALLKLKTGLHAIVDFLAALMPFQWGASVFSRIVVLAALTLLPAIVMNELTKRRSHLPFNYSYLLSTLLFLFVAVLLTVSFNY